MAQIFKAKTLVANTGKFAYEVSAPNLIFNTGNQTISGTKTFVENTVFGDPNQSDFLVISGNNFTVYGSGNFSSGLFVNGVPVLTGSPDWYATSSNLNLTGSILNNKIDSLSGYVDFSNNNTVFTTGDQTINGLKDFTTRPTVNTIPVLLSGEKAAGLNLLVKNDEPFTVYKSQPVYINGANGNNILIKLARNTGEDTSSKTLGLLSQDLAPNGEGYITTEGQLEGVDTSAAGSAGDPIWLGPTGNLIFGTANKPYGLNHLVYLGVVERKQANNGKIYVKVQNGFEIGELHNVDVNHTYPLGNNQVLKYNSQSGLWFNSSLTSNDLTNKNDIVYTTGNQTIAGDKNFLNNINISGNVNVTGSVVARTGIFGLNNNISGLWLTMAGGSGNIITANHSVIGGGQGNRVSGNFSFIGGGRSNFISAGSNGFSFIGGGNQNTVSAGALYGATIGGGCLNTACNDATVGGGVANRAFGAISFVGGGVQNCAASTISSIGGGCGNYACSVGSSIGGGFFNVIGSSVALSDYSFIGGGLTNSIGGAIPAFLGCSVIAGGFSNKINSSTSSIITYASTIGGGVSNCIDTAGCSVIGGGLSNLICSCFSIIGGGECNSICPSAPHSYIGGGRRSVIQQFHSGAAVLGDGQSRLHNSSGAHTLTLDFASGVYFASPQIYGSLIFNSPVNAINGLRASGNSVLTGVDLSSYATIANLVNTGSILNNKINSLSGWSASAVDLTATGSNLYNSIISLSGLFTGYTGSLDATFATDSQLFTTGSILNDKINSLSGYVNSQDVIFSGQTASTGSILDSKINALSGYISGISAGGLLPNSIVYITGNQIISGNKTFLNNISVSGTGNFNNVRVSSIDNLFLSGIDIIITGNSSINIYNPIYISGNPVLTGIDLNSYATISNLVSTGLILDNKINSLSGYVNSRDSLFSGQTASTGSILDNKINTLSGLFAGYTGSLDNTFATDAQLFSTGSTLDNKINSLSGYVNSRDILFSGQIASTGSILDNKINNLSGYINTSDSNIVFTTGNQTIAGIKTFEVGNGDSKVIISGSDAFDYALSVVNNSNQGNVLFLKKGTNPGGGAVSENFVIKAVDRADDLIFTLKSTQAGTNRAGFFCDPDGVSDAGGPNVSADSVVISGRTYTIGEIDNQLQYILSDSNSIQAVNPVYSYTGGLFFDNNGLNLKFVDKNGNYSALNPIEVTSGNDVLINGNSSFGIYQQGTLYPNGTPTDTSINHLTRHLNSLGFYYGIVSGTNFVSGLKPGNLLYYTTKNNAGSNFTNNARTRAKARPYMVVDEASNYNNSYTVNTSPVSPGNNGNFSFLKFNNNSQYSGLAIKQLIFNPTIQNAYRSYNLWSGVNIEVKPKNIHLETFIDVNVKSGNYWSTDNLGLTRYANNITVKKPKATNFTQSHVLNFKLNFQRDDRVTKVVNYPNRIVTIYNPDNIPTITITGYDYEFSQKLRLILNTDGSLKEW